MRKRAEEKREKKGSDLFSAVALRENKSDPFFSRFSSQTLRGRASRQRPVIVESPRRRLANGPAITRRLSARSREARQKKRGFNYLKASA
jgi:hypothetical protein